jgi:carbon monoxide dehydrogenase subunit G
MKIQVTEEISAPIETVFDVFADIPKVVDRVPGIVSLEVLSSETSGLGLRWRETRTMFGQEATEVMEMTGFDPPHSYFVEAESHGMHYQSTYTFEENSDGVTTVTMEFIGTPVSFVARLFTPLALLFQGATKRALRQDMLDLKAFIES